MSDSTFKTWGLEQDPISIEYSLVVLEEIRHEVNQGLQRIARGGIEVGGALYGVSDGRKIRIEAMRPIACNHTQGPAFVLSPEDRNGLEQQLRESLQDPHLEGLICVGWFVSHNRGELTLTGQDLEIFNDFFPDSWEVTLLVRPGRSTTTQAAFFIRGADGTVNAERPHQKFDFPDRLAGVLDRSARKDRIQEKRRGFRELPALPQPPTPIQSRGPQAVPNYAQPIHSHEGFQYGNSFMEGQLPMPAPRRGGGGFSKWVIAMVALVLILLGAGGALYYYGSFRPSKPESIGLAMAEHDGQLQIEWNAAAHPVTNALKGELEIVDGGQSQILPLMIADLAKGQYSYPRKTGDVEVRLNIRGPDNVQTSEASRFLGQAPAPAAKAEMAVLDDKKAQLESQITSLKATNAMQAERIQQLQRTLQIMQTRLGIQQSAEPPQ